MSLVTRVAGPVIDRGPDFVVIEVGGLGIRVYCPPALAARSTEGSRLLLHTHLQLREDLMALYGFEHKQDLSVFENLIAVSGVGPRVALALLSTVGAERLAAAIGQGDAATLTRVPGIGKKTAERLILELRDHFKGYSAEGDIAPTAGGADDVIAALVALGYSANEAREAAGRAPVTTSATTEEKILAALRSLDSR